MANINKILIGIVVLAVIGVVLLSGCVEEKQTSGNISQNITQNAANQGNIELKVFHAGSLTEPLAEVEKEFENQHKNIDVQREAAGSVQTIKKVTELHKDVDVVASADAFLIPKMMYPNYSDFTIKFATNDIVIAYTNKSNYWNEINEDNWYQILRKNDVKFGFSNPNNDPCGYRSIMTMQLAEFKYNDSKIFDDLVEKNTNIKANCNSTCTIVVPNSTQINPDTNKVMVRSLEMELISGLQSREIEYFFIYRSVAVQQKFNFIELPSKINLGDDSKNEIYNRVNLKQANGKVQQGNAIVYGLTIPKNAQHKKEAVEFVKLLISKDGRKIFENLGQPPLNPAIVDNISNIPIELKEFVIEEKPKENIPTKDASKTDKTSTLKIGEKTFTFEELSSQCEKKEINNQTGIALDCIIKKVIDEPEKYTYALIGSDGYQKTVTFEDTQKGILTNNESQVVFEHLPKGYRVRDMVEIRPSK